MDCSLMENDCIDARLKSGKPGIVCQIDIEKASNCMN